LIILWFHNVSEWGCVKNEGSALRAEIFQIYQKSFSLYINSLICEIWSDLYDFFDERSE